MNSDVSVRSVPDSERGRWDNLTTHPLQSWDWGEFRQAMGIDVVRLGVYERGRLTKVLQLTFHKLPLTPFCIGYFPKGPTPTNDMLAALVKLGREKHALAVQLEPDTTIEEPMEVNKKFPLRRAHHPLFTKYTFVLDLTKSEDELSRAMHSKTRYNIRLAQKHDVTITEDNSDNAFASYLALSEETTNRQGFYAHNTKYHQTMWNILRKHEIAHLFTATHQNTIIAAWIVFVWKDTVYYPYGASSRKYREVMAPNLMLWEIARWAKKKGLFYFDLWGALGPKPDSHDPWYGFHRFKEGYGANLVEFIGSFDLIINPVLYPVYTAADSLRWLFLRLQKTVRL